MQGRREGEGGGGRGQNTWGPDWLGRPKLTRGALNLGKTSSHGCDCQEGRGHVMCRHLLVLGPNPGSAKFTTNVRTHKMMLNNAE